MLGKVGVCTNGDPDLTLNRKLDYKSSIFGAFGTFLGILAISVIEHHTGYELIIASFGASAMIVFLLPTSVAAQPRSVVGGHIISGLIGVSTRQIAIRLNNVYPPLALGTAAGLSSFFMSITHCGHPPGVATALVAYMESGVNTAEAFYYIVHPITTGICILVVIALLYNNLSPERRYPTFWL